MVENGNLQDVILDTKIPTETLIEEKTAKESLRSQSYAGIRIYKACVFQRVMVQTDQYSRSYRFCGS